jgi:predicted glycoside hydrolase/deacetylase ChbG (UPF0249 family)
MGRVRAASRCRDRESLIIADLYNNQMAARLILNADDFGLTRGINRAIIELYEAGALTSATLMANGPAFEDAVSIALANPSLGVGCHIVLTDGTPVSPPKAIPSLLGPDGKNFRPSLVSFLAAILLGRVNEAEISLEAAAQIQRLQQAGIHVTHIDTHKHTHMFPAVARPVLLAAEAAGVHAIRNPFEEPWSIALSGSELTRRIQVRLIHYLRPRFLAMPQIRNGIVRTTNGTIGISATGNLNQTTLHAVLDTMPNGTWEVVCHPGYNDKDLDSITTRLRSTREIEREALLSMFAPASNLSAQRNPFTLIHYSDV